MNISGGKIFDSEMISRMLESPNFRTAIESNLDEPALLNKAPTSYTCDDLIEIEDACKSIFTSIAPIVCRATIPEGSEEDFNDDPLPLIIGCDEIYSIWDIAGFGLYETWYSTPEAAIAEAQQNWTELEFLGNSTSRQTKAASEGRAESPAVDGTAATNNQDVAEAYNTVALKNLTHLLDEAVKLYEARHPDSDYKSTITGMAHLHRKWTYKNKVAHYIADHGCLPLEQELQSWINEG